MEDGTGFDLLERFEKIDFHIIFVTAYQEYAVKAFKFSAIDYLLKPLEPEELQNAIERLRNILNAEQESRVTNLLMNIKETRREEKKIVLRTADKFHFIKVSDIIYCESDGNYTNFWLEGGNKVMISKSLKEYEEILTEYGFFRPHKSYLINLAYITGFEKGEGGYIILSDNNRIPISFRKKEEFLRIVEGM
jgi:two-component system LytT family response regulator